MVALKRSLRPGELAKKGVELVDRLQDLRGRLTLRCKECGATWTHENIEGRLPGGYWQCPNGCNTPTRPL